MQSHVVLEVSIMITLRLAVKRQRFGRKTENKIGKHIVKTAPL